MRKDSPVLQALEDDPNIDLVSCRKCGKKYHQMELRWFRWGANDYCSERCWKHAIKEYRSSEETPT